jgi:hypothetical protein
VDVAVARLGAVTSSQALIFQAAATIKTTSAPAQKRVQPSIGWHRFFEPITSLTTGRPITLYGGVGARKRLFETIGWAMRRVLPRIPIIIGPLQILGCCVPATN